MKKATKKRDRKYGKSEEDAVDEVVLKKKIKESVRVIVDGYVVRTFPSRADAEKFINKENRESDKLGRTRASFVYV